MSPQNRSGMGRFWLMAAACAAAVLIVGVAAGFGLSQLMQKGGGGDAGRSSRASKFEIGVAEESTLNFTDRENAAKVSEKGLKFAAAANLASLQPDDQDIYSSTIRLINNGGKASQCLEARQREDAIEKQLQLVECNSASESQNWTKDIYGHIRPENSLEDCIVFNGPPGDTPTARNAVQLQSCASADLSAKQWLQSSGGHIRLRSESEWCLDAHGPPVGVVLSPCLYGSLGQWFFTDFPVAGPAVPGPTPAPTLPGPSSAPDDFNFYAGRNCDAKSIKAKTVSSAEQCGELCTDDSNCIAYSFKTSNQRCYLKKECTRWKDEELYVTGIMPYYDIQGDGAGELICTDPKDEAKCELPDMEGSSDLSDSSSETRRGNSDSSSLSRTRVASDKREDDDSSSGEEKECPEWSVAKEESADPLPDDSTFVPPYKNILDGEKDFVTTFPENRDFATCPFRPPTSPRSKDWADECIKNARNVGFLDNENNRPNKECPAGWFLCKGMCYTLVQRNSRGPSIKNAYYTPDYMSAEARCGICGGARVAFIGNDPEMEKVAAEAAAQTINTDKAVFVRRFRFLKEPNPLVEKNDNPYQPWHKFVILSDHNDREATYQRYYTGEKDGLSRPGWDRGYRNQEGSILCVNTIDRINAAARTVNSRLSMESGCQGEDRFDRWDDKKHRWLPEHNWPYPGL